MAETQFLSDYKGITYKIPGTNKLARFQDGRLTTNDEQVKSYLRDHPDFGKSLHDITRTGPAIVVGVNICPDCKRIIPDKRAGCECKQPPGDTGQKDAKTKPKPAFICTVPGCGRTFASKPALMAHMRAHK